MKTVTFAGLKGGIGKSSLAILTANYLAAAGYRILFADFDIQNSGSFYYLEEPEIAETRNLANALQHDELPANIVQGLWVDLIPASFNLLKLRSLPDKTFKRLLPQVSEDYDFLICDTSPTFDNIVLNAISASDLIVTPAYLSLFDLKSAVFARDQYDLEADKLGAWRLLLNRYKEPRTNNPDAEVNQYLALFTGTFGDHIMNTRIPDTTKLQRAIDTKTPISTAKAKERLHSAIQALVSELTGITTNVEKF